jgi:hypothetical protein
MPDPGGADLDGAVLRKNTKVVRVLEHIPGPRQLRMF